MDLKNISTMSSELKSLNIYESLALHVIIASNILYNQNLTIDEIYKTFISWRQSFYQKYT